MLQGEILITKIIIVCPPFTLFVVGCLKICIFHAGPTSVLIRSFI